MARRLDRFGLSIATIFAGASGDFSHKKLVSRMIYAYLCRLMAAV